MQLANDTETIRTIMIPLYLSINIIILSSSYLRLDHVYRGHVTFYQPSYILIIFLSYHDHH